MPRFADAFQTFGSHPQHYINTSIPHFIAGFSFLLEKAMILERKKNSCILIGYRSSFFSNEQKTIHRKHIATAYSFGPSSYALVLLSIRNPYILANQNP